MVHVFLMSMKSETAYLRDVKYSLGVYIQNTEDEIKHSLYTYVHVAL